MLHLGAYIPISTNAFFFSVEAAQVVRFDSELRAMIAEGFAPGRGLACVEVYEDYAADYLVYEVGQLEILEDVYAVIGDGLAARMRSRAILQ